MKKKVTVVILIIIVVVFGIFIYYFWQKNQQDPIVYETEQAIRRYDVVKKTVATGSIVPKEEILIKPNISGIIDEIFVEAGDIIESGDLIARVKVIPNVSTLTSAKNNINSARTSWKLHAWL